MLDFVGGGYRNRTGVHGFASYLLRPKQLFYKNLFKIALTCIKLRETVKLIDSKIGVFTTVILDTSPPIPVTIRYQTAANARLFEGGGAKVGRFGRALPKL